jgi:hypothetical protein
MSYQGNYPPSTPLTSDQIAAGAVQPTNLSSVGPTWDGSGNLTITGGMTAGTAVMNIGSGQLYKDASGNVGIGTSSPGYKLDVVTTGVRFQSGTSQTSVYVGPQTNSGYIYGQSNEFGFYSDTTNAQVSISKLVGGQYLLLSGGTGASSYIGLNTGGSERARIDSSGNFLIGGTDAYGKLRVLNSTANSGIRIDQTTSSTNYAAFLCNVDNAGNDLVYWAYQGVKKGSVTTNGSTVAYNTSSDYRLKNSVTPMMEGLATISALKPVTYKWNTDDSDGEGFIAHELQEVIPLAVTGEKDAIDRDGNIDPQSVDYSKIVVHLVAAIQELKAEIDALKGAK